MKVVIVGGSGWISQSAESVLVHNYKIQPDTIEFYGSHARKITRENNRQYQVHEWQPSDMKQFVDLFIPLGFNTVDRYHQVGERNFLQINRSLIERAEKFILKNGPRRCVLFSSGIVNKDLRTTERTKAYRVYAQLKSEEENVIEGACQSAGTSLTICRLFSASGRFMSEPRKYAFGDLIWQAINLKKVTVTSSHLVWRRYVDMEQIVDLCLQISERHKNFKFDSSGSLIEVRDLAAQIARKFGVRSIQPECASGEADHYYSTRSDMDEVAEALGYKFMDLDEQIEKTSLRFRPL